jgi:hypothetical protein
MEETRIVTVGDKTYQVAWLVDRWPDLLEFGKYTDREDDHVIDRRRGVLLGELEPEPDHAEYVPDDTGGLSVEALDALEDAYWTAYDEWASEGRRQVLATGLPTWRDARTSRFFVSNRTLPHSPRNWDHVADEEVQALLERYQKDLARYGIQSDDPREALDILLACQDYVRMEDYENGLWYMTYCVVTRLVGGVPMGSDQVGGVPSDEPDSYRVDVEQWLMHGADAETRHVLAQVHAETSKACHNCGRSWPGHMYVCWDGVDGCGAALGPLAMVDSRNGKCNGSHYV